MHSHEHTYSVPAEGFATLWPKCAAGDDLRTAWAVAEVDPRYPRAAFGFALEQGDTRIRLEAQRVDRARMVALSMLDSGPVTLYEAIAAGHGDQLLYRRLEQLDKYEPSEAPGAALPVSSAGVILAKGAAAPSVLEAAAQSLAGNLSKLDARWSKPLLKKFLAQLDIDWGNATGEQIDQAFVKADRVIRKAQFEPLIAPWIKRTTVELWRTATGTRDYIRQTFLPRVGPTFSMPDRRAIQQIATQQGWFLRGQMGLRSDRITARGREIVQSGLAQGLGRGQIGRDLKLALPDLWNRYGNNYARVVASVAVNRARSWGEVLSYRDAGIEYLELQAVLDEATTVFCRFIDGQIISVDNCFDLLEKGAAVQKPEDIKRVNPFMVQRRDQETGQRYIATANGTRLADIVRSGVGISSPPSSMTDARGTFNARMMGNQLPNALIGAPPYHHL